MNNNIDLEEFIIGLSKLQLRCGVLGKINIKDAVNIALRGQNLQVDDDFKLTVLQDKPKFEIGDWIVRKDGTPFGLNDKRVAQIIDVTVDKSHNSLHTYWISKDERAQEYICDCVDDFRKWTIQDAKDGDVLAAFDCILIFKKLLPENEGVSYCHYDFGFSTPRFFSNKDYGWRFGKEAKVYPATKEQRDLLFQKMKEAGYKWDAQKKGLLHDVDELESALCSWLYSDTRGKIPPKRIIQIAKTRAKEIREKLK